jgi:pimeloyl-ACP methyl ester carboxylesterase
MNRRALLLLALVAMVGGCAAGPPDGSPYPLSDGSAARRWGDGPYGVVLIPATGADAGAWDAAARALAGEGRTAVAIPEPDAGLAEAAIRQLQAGGIERVAVIATGAGSDAAFELGTSRPELVDQLITLSARGDVSRLGVFPKLFVGSEVDGEADEAERMAAEAPGDWNVVYMAAGEATGLAILDDRAALEVVVQRLEERR